MVRFSRTNETTFSHLRLNKDEGSHMKIMLEMSQTADYIDLEQFFKNFFNNSK